jgi:hypothetical protein
MADKIEVKIICNQTDCIHNKYGAMEYICTHLHPAIQRYRNLNSVICNSKERDMTDPEKPKKHPIPFACLNCDNKSPEYCINVCSDLMVDESKLINRDLTTEKNVCTDCKPKRTFGEVNDNDEIPIPKSLIEIIAEENDDDEIVIEEIDDNNE